MFQPLVEDWSFTWRRKSWVEKIEESLETDETSEKGTSKENKTEGSSKRIKSVRKKKKNGTKAREDDRGKGELKQFFVD